MKEIWKDIKDYEGKYQVSNMGRIKSLTKWNIAKQRHETTEKILKTTSNHYGYKCTMLSKNKTRKNIQVHRLVAEAFIPNPENKKTVNHIDGNKQNNCVHNLEWCTNSENLKHAFDTGLRGLPFGNKNHRYNKFGKEHNRSKSIVQYTLNGKVVAKYGSQHEAQRKTGISAQGISFVCTGKRKTAGGYKWSFEHQQKETENNVSI